MTALAGYDKRAESTAIHAAKGGWTEERLEQLKTMWMAGRTASQCAQALGGVTRNAVIGKVGRLGWTRTETPAPKRKVALRPRPLRAQAPKPAAVAAPLAPPVAVPVAAPRPQPIDPKPLEALGRRQCRNPVNDGQDPAHGWLYCADPVTDGGGQYCANCRRTIIDLKRTAASSRHLRLPKGLR